MSPRPLSNITSVDRNEVNMIERALNKIMPTKFPWWKEIQIDHISYTRTRVAATIGGSLKVDEDWGYSQFRKFYMDKPFPGNSYWGEGYEEDAVLLGDVINPVHTSEESKNFNNEISSIFSMVTGIFITNLQINNLILEFV